MNDLELVLRGETYPVQDIQLLVHGLHLTGLPVLTDFNPGNWFVRTFDAPVLDEQQRC